MEELITKIEIFKNYLEKDEIIKETKKVLEKINNDKELIKLIEEYKSKPIDELKYKIYSNENYRRYKELENDINIMILQINNKLKEITSKDQCSLWKY